MDTTKLKNFAQSARKSLIEQVEGRLKIVLAVDSLARRESAKAVQALEQKIHSTSTKNVIDHVAYTWFNRFSALRFMDVNRYNRVGIVTPLQNETLPEILSDAIGGHLDNDVVNGSTRKRVQDLLMGRVSSRDAQGEAYRLLLVAYCNSLSDSIPFLFERIDDYTELLLPTNLLTQDSVLSSCREAMTLDACKDVEVIGWLYQYYISEKKDEVFKNFKKKKKAGPKEIPAATQLFTPHWIVRYLVENSLGRLWMLNNPNSRLIEKMEYYIKPEEQETDFLRINSPEEIKVNDPACGSGHMLTYAFDLLYAIYEEKGYDSASIPRLILTKNLYGIEIDERAGELAAFALLMKARDKDKNFLRKPIEPNICVLENITFEQDEIKKYVEHVGLDVFTSDILTTLNQFEEADNFGSLIIPEASNVEEALTTLKNKNMEGEMFLTDTHTNILKALKQADYLSQKYHVVVANPPYMGGGNMNTGLANWVKKNYPNSKSDLCTCFIERNLKLAKPKGLISMITMQSWMFLSSFEKLRDSLLDTSTITSMAHLGARAFDSIGGEVVSTTSFVIDNQYKKEFKGTYIRIVDEKSEKEKQTSLAEAIKNPDCGWFYRVSADNFKKIPGSPIAYWIPEKILSLFDDYKSIGEQLAAGNGLQTNDNSEFLRFWYEPSINKIGFGVQYGFNVSKTKSKWFPYNKGGSFRRWFGNNEYVVNWENDGTEIKARKAEDLAIGKITANNSKCWNEKFYFHKAVTWSDVTSAKNSFRLSEGSLFDITAPSVFPANTISEWELLSFLNSKLCEIFTQILNPTLHFNIGNFRNIPCLFKKIMLQSIHVQSLTRQAQEDWDSYETSWDFNSLPLLDASYRGDTLASTYSNLRAHWNEMTQEMQKLEEENNRIFIEAYDLEDELTPDVPLKEITLTCNPNHRYGNNKTESELEALLLTDTMKELISYAVGCMFGRYSLDKPGLVLANQGETYEDYCKLVPSSSFPADEDNVLPILDGEWFSDDIVGRFKKFLKVTFGEEHYEENLRFVEDAIGKNIRTYFLNDFYNDHVRRYKKRPIYWMFSSQGGGFNALIYMHRYKSDTVSIVRSNYLVDYISKISYRIEHLQRIEASVDISKSEKTKALKELTQLRKRVDELNKYERDTLFPLAASKVEIDLDDGVKVNYPKFGNALKKIAGLEAKEEE